MISVADAYDIVVSNALELGSELVSLENAIGRILAEEVYADRPMPPFDRVCMDGIAIDHTTFSNGQKEFEVENLGKAGSPQLTLNDPQKCIEIMTGAPLPRNTNTVVRYEDLEDLSGSFKINVEVFPERNIHFKGSDHSKEDKLLNKRKTISTADINLLATLGKTKVKVYKMPRVVVISSGDELVPISEKPEDHQIRRSNVHMLKARTKELGINASDSHILDEKEAIREGLKAIEYDHDVLMLCGGVSKGKLDFIPEILEELGFEKLFHRVKQRPGKPFWFGRKKNRVVFAFPGNPVSSLACFHKYFVPWLNKTINKEDQQTPRVRLKNDVTFKPDLTYFVQARVDFDENANIIAEIQQGNGSGDLVNPTSMDGFVELPDGRSEFKAGEIFEFISYKTLIK